MFETAELGRIVTKAEYDKREPKLRTRLLQLQTRLRDHGKVPVLVLINGVDGAGKGDAVNLLHEWMDPRWLRTFAYGPKAEEEAQRPHWWRYWRDLPARGTVGVFFGNWYTDPIVQRVHKDIDEDAFENQLLRIQAFERALVEDGALLIKLWDPLESTCRHASLSIL